MYTIPFALWFFLWSRSYLLGRGPKRSGDWIAFYTLGAGIIGAALAAVPGIIDYFSIKDPKVSKIATWHARLNVLALLVFAASFYLRTNNGSQIVNGSFTAPVLLSVLGVILISISGYLGGEMVYVHHVAVESEQSATTGDRAPGRSAS